jgi:replicative DNA helicase
VIAERKVVPIPTSLALAERQYAEAVRDLERDHGAQPQFGWPEVARLVGPFLPGDLWVFGARPGNGKTTLLLNAMDALVRDRYPCLYLTTEMRASEMRRRWAALRLGYDADAVLENDWSRLPADACEQVRAHLEWQALEASGYATFVDVPVLDREHAGRAVRDYGIREGFRFVFVDHIHRWQPRDLNNKTGEMTAAVQGIKAAAVEHGLTMFLAAQVGRGVDRNPLADFLPAPTSALKQTGALEEEANVIFMLHRQRRKDATAQMAKEVLAGQRDVRDLLEPGILCAGIGKHRNRPKVLGRTIRLQVAESCRLTELDQPAKVRLGLAAAFTDEGSAREPDDEPGLPF